MMADVSEIRGASGAISGGAWGGPSSSAGGVAMPGTPPAIDPLPQSQLVPDTMRDVKLAMRADSRRRLTIFALAFVVAGVAVAAFLAGQRSNTEAHKTPPPVTAPKETAKAPATEPAPTAAAPVAPTPSANASATTPDALADAPSASASASAKKKTAPMPMRMITKPKTDEPAPAPAPAPAKTADPFVTPE
jgi:cytoskeletal protein RodZ